MSAITEARRHHTGKRECQDGCEEPLGPRGDGFEDSRCIRSGPRGSQGFALLFLVYAGEEPNPVVLMVRCICDHCYPFLIAPPPLSSAALTPQRWL